MKKKVSDFIESLETRKDLVIVKHDRLLLREHLEGGGHSDYEIGWDQIQSVGESVFWFMHLVEKQWITRDHIVQFALAISDRFNLGVAG